MINSDKKVAKVAEKYYCKICYYECCRKNNYEKHLSTVKHKKLQNMIISDEIMINSDKKVAKVEKVENEKFVCLCGKSYKHKRSLWYHQTTCDYNEPICQETQKSGISEELVFKLLEKIEEKDKRLEEKDKQLENVVKENTELTKTIVNSNLGGHHNNTINNNQQFNINMFLNEQCKDAINMTDFIKSIQVSFEQLDYTKVNGLEKGITKILMDNMNKLGKYERPIHCTDIKRETLYIKEDDKWEKDKDKDKIKKAINKTSNKNFTALCQWKNNNNNFMEYDDKQAYFAKTMSKIGKPVSEVEDKIIKTICKENYVKE
tara:strand:+ start:159 stop:1112 length:954 start_codon:yes stop_codon:yes gene_type:complete